MTGIFYTLLKGKEGGGQVTHPIAGQLLYRQYVTKLLFTHNCQIMIKMQVSTFDLTEFPHS